MDAAGSGSLTFEKHPPSFPIPIATWLQFAIAVLGGVFPTVEKHCVLFFAFMLLLMLLLMLLQLQLLFLLLFVVVAL